MAFRNEAYVGYPPFARMMILVRGALACSDSTVPSQAVPLPDEVCSLKVVFIFHCYRNQNLVIYQGINYNLV